MKVGLGPVASSSKYCIPQLDYTFYHFQHIAYHPSDFSYIPLCVPLCFLSQPICPCTMVVPFQHITESIELVVSLPSKISITVQCKVIHFKVLIFGYTCGILSSRAIFAACTCLSAPRTFPAPLLQQWRYRKLLLCNL